MASKKNRLLSPKRSVAFKVFASENRGRLLERYPFLTDQQIQVKLRHSWRKGRGRKDGSLQSSPIKATPRVQDKEKASSSTESSQDSLKLEWSGSDNEDISTSEITAVESSSEWNDKSTEMEPLTVIHTESLTEVAVKDVLAFSLDVEGETGQVKDTTVMQKKKVLSGLFGSEPKAGEADGQQRKTESRLLTSEEKEGKSNFNTMFNDEDAGFF